VHATYEKYIFLGWAGNTLWQNCRFEIKTGFLSKKMNLQHSFYGSMAVLGTLE
jgi:hypothetical protein